MDIITTGGWLGKQNYYTEFVCNGGESVYVCPGKFSAFDILVKYKQNGSRPRTPKHIHWVVDVLLKKQMDESNTKILLEHLTHIWNRVSPIKNQAQRENIIPKYSKYPKECAALDGIGFYSVEFIVLLAELLAMQEKTNNPQAYMFGRVLDTIQHSDDIFAIISAAGYRGR